MKIKTDFVTNSSSSSFIVMFPKRVLVFDDVFQHIHRVDVCHRILKDILEQTPTILSPESYTIFLEDLKEGHLYEDVVVDGKTLISSDSKLEKEWAGNIYNKYKDFASIKGWEGYNNIRTEEAKAYVNALLNKYEEGYIYRLTYADNCGEFESMIEHGNTFKNLPHIQFSYH